MRIFLSPKKARTKDPVSAINDHPSSIKAATPQKWEDMCMTVHVNHKAHKEGIPGVDWKSLPGGYLLDSLKGSVAAICSGTTTL